MALLGDRPLVQYTLEAARESRRLDRSVFTSDDLEMISFARQLGCEAPFQRPPDLGSDSTPMNEVVIHALNWLEKEEGYRPGGVVLLQPTCPFRDALDIDRSIDAFERAGSETLLSVSPVLQHPCEMVRVRDGGLSWAVEKPSGCRQSFPEFYFIDGAIYIATPGFLRRAGTFHDGQAAVHVLDRLHGIDIDEPDQLDLARGLLLVRASQEAARSAGRQAT
jgi:CMP-N-acetylneuraminic acid synthetase